MKYSKANAFSGLSHDINPKEVGPSSVSCKSRLPVCVAALVASVSMITIDDVEAATKKSSKNKAQSVKTITTKKTQNNNQPQKAEITNQKPTLQTEGKLPATNSKAQAASANSTAKKTSEVAENKTEDNLGEVIVTGSRQTGIKTRQSSSPVVVISANTIKATGQANLIDALSKVDTSFYVPARSGDLGNITRQVQLRQLGPNETLVLINGKRRHSTAVVNASGAFAGATGVDLAQIPVSAIDRIEVLKDGAAAQYGSDAIAGVVNIILKAADNGGSASASYGRYEPSNNPNTSVNGDTYNLTANNGFKIPKLDQGFLNLSAEWTDQNHTNDSGINPNANGHGTPGWTNVIAGQPSYDLYDLGFNTGFKATKDIDIYAFGTAGHRFSSARQNYRNPTNNPTVYPNGYAPVESLDETDFGVTAGVKGVLLGNGRWDLSSTYGSDTADISVSNSVNNALFAATHASPTSFNNGTFTNSQLTTNLDLSKPVNLGFLPAPLNIAGGVEHRRETYQLSAGDYASTYSSGSVAFPGYTVHDARDKARDVIANYLELGTKWTPKLQSTLAGRYEHYSDAGDATTGKVSTRYDYSPRFAIRGTASTGFRAPTLAESNFSATNVSPTTTTVQLAVNSPGANLLGATALKPENSTSLSTGFVFEPIEKVLSSIDFYQIDISNRIVDSSSISSAIAPLAVSALQANGINPNNAQTPGSVNLTYFTNGVSTRTRGIDVVTDWNTDFDNYGLIKWKYSGSYAETQVTDVKNNTTNLGGQALIGPNVISVLENSVPKFKQTLSANYLLKNWTVNARVTHYGETSQLYTNQVTGLAPYQNVKIKDTALVDLSIGYDFIKNLNLTVGANNIFGIRPNQQPNTTAIRGSSLASVYPTFSPFSVDGTFFYVRTTFKF